MRFRAAAAVVLVLSSGGRDTGAQTKADPRATPRAPVVVTAMNEPVAVATGDGRVHVAYELHVSNFDASAGVLRLESLEAFAEQQPTPLLSYRAEELDTRVMHPAAEPTKRHGRTIDPGRQAVVHVWLALAPKQPLPVFLRHRLVFRDANDAETTVDGAPVRVSPRRPPLVGAPFKRGTWLVHNGPSNHRAAHWGSLLALNGRVTVPQRFAVDFIGLDEHGKGVRKDVRSSANEDWAGFGIDVVAVADGVVRELNDGVVDNVPLAPVAPPTAITASGIYGNYVIVEMNGGMFAHYAHLQRGSVAVRQGGFVRRGQMLGRLGNSGNTNGPHLHFHISDRLSFEESEGLPFAIEAFETLGDTTAEKALGVEAPSGFAAPRQRRAELPLHGAVVRFR
jgi:hypothetical protein